MPYSELHDVAPGSVEMASPSTYVLGDKAVGTGCLFRLGAWLAERRGGDEAVKSGTTEKSKLP